MIGEIDKWEMVEVGERVKWMKWEKCDLAYVCFKISVEVEPDAGRLLHKQQSAVVYNGYGLWS